MNNMEHLDDGNMPETFDEVIKLGFPHENLAALAKAHRERKLSRPKPKFAPLSLATSTTAAAAAVTRKDQASMPQTERDAFKNAVIQLVNEGKYVDLIRFHMDMSHNMHGSMGAVGLYRFLAWHRRYLVAFERELQRADAILRPTATQKLGVPYWRWQDTFPSWLNGFLPSKIPNTNQPAPPRKNAAPPSKANLADINIIVNQFNIQTPGLPGNNLYTKFTYGIEGFGKRPDGSSLPAHNHGHGWIGGIMNNTSTSPTDPIFWLHHAEIDRLWQIWRGTNPTPKPPLTGSDRIMDPWAESYANLLDTVGLGYVYDSTTP